uniref:ditrans,polycis-polyprenyl diphosphate synthase [(2E,6E)-farnesyldiphosphate specific] n=1 Tax=Lutzomyia longipalpis TaxID=7200 RepID=A0A1B0CHF8_LUTLO
MVQAEKWFYLNWSMKPSPSLAIRHISPTLSTSSRSPRFSIWWQHELEFLLLRLAVGLKVPQHVALILDGNRRYAREVNLPIGIAYVEGFNVMQRVLRWLYLLGVSEVTVFAFSIDNFRRSQSDIQILQAVTLHAFKNMALHTNIYNEANVRFQVIGRCKMFPEEISEIMHVAETETKDLNGMIFNFFCRILISR